MRLNRFVLSLPLLLLLISLNPCSTSYTSNEFFFNLTEPIGEFYASFSGKIGGKISLDHVDICIWISVTQFSEGQEVIGAAINGIIVSGEVLDENMSKLYPILRKSSGYVYFSGPGGGACFSFQILNRTVPTKGVYFSLAFNISGILTIRTMGGSSNEVHTFCQVSNILISIAEFPSSPCQATFAYIRSGINPSSFILYSGLAIVFAFIGSMVFIKVSKPKTKVVVIKKRNF